MSTPRPHAPRISSRTKAIRWSITVALLLSCYVVLLGAGGAAAAAESDKPAVAQDVFEAYVAWLHEAHEHAAVHGDPGPLPSQF